MGGTWEAPGAVLESPGADFEAPWKALAVPWDAPGGQMMATLRLSWGSVDAYGAILDQPKAGLEPSFASWKPCLGSLEPFWAGLGQPGAVLGHLRPLWSHF